MPTFREAASCLLWVWFGGIVWSVAVVVRDLVRLRRLGRSLVPCASPAAIGLVDEAARAVGLKVKPETRAGVARFLDSVEGDEAGSIYGYILPGTNKTTTAIGLLGRFRSGWKPERPGLVPGVAAVVGRGPSGNIYHDYHASRLVHAAADAKAWADWRASVADHLIKGQLKEGADAGSWRAREVEPLDRVTGK